MVSRRLNRSEPVRPKEGTYLAHRQGNPFLRFLPWEHAHFRLRREHRGFHGDGVRMRRISSGRISTGVWQLRTKSRVTVQTKSGLVRYILVRNLSTISIVMSGRRLSSSGPQPVILLS